jgi:hypothetical protein
MWNFEQMRRWAAVQVVAAFAVCICGLHERGVIIIIEVAFSCEIFSRI